MAAEHGWECLSTDDPSTARIELFAPPALRDPDLLLRAMAAGAACLSFGPGVHEELLENDVTGVLSTPAEIPAEAERLIRDSDRRNRLGDMARRQAERYNPLTGGLSLGVAITSATR